MGVVFRRRMIATDASRTGWVFEGRPACGVWTGEALTWHINCLELRAVFLGLRHFLPFLMGHHVIVRTDNMAVVSYVNHQGTHGRAPWTGMRAISSCGPRANSGPTGQSMSPGL